MQKPFFREEQTQPSAYVILWISACVNCMRSGADFVTLAHIKE